MNQTERRGIAQRRFDFESWPVAGTPDATGGPAALRGFALSLADETDEWTFERRAAYGDSGYTDFFHVAGQPARRALIDVIECPTPAAARMALLDLLSEAMAITLPRLEDGRVGEVAFTGHDGRTEAVRFVRLNIVVDVRSIGEEAVSVLSLATLADRQIQAQAFTTSTGGAAT